ncbi:SulP family inorganic anion transporter [Chloroflexota bacterium]|nr:SulP family inorganic anion transporter [Chloroflexota bacterium]
MKLSLQSIQRYFRGKFRSDLSAGLTVGMVVIPQSMAIAAIAGVNPLYGLYTAIIPTIIGAIFGSFPYLVTGPTNPTALVTASVLLAYADRPDYLEFVLAVAVLAGVFKLLFGLFKIARISRYISNSVLVGFLSAAGVLIIANQLGNLVGLTLERSSGAWGILKSLLINIQDVHLLSLAVSLIAIALMILIRAINPKLPAALATIVFVSLLAHLLNWNSLGVRLVDDVGLPQHLAIQLHVPNITLESITDLLIPSAAVALFGLMEAVSITKAMSQMTGDPLDPSKEMIGQGLASTVGGFFLCIPSSGSPSRTVINVVNGAKTKASAIISGLSVWIFILLFSRLIGYIPIPALAGVVVVSSASLINPDLIKMTWQSRLNSRIVLLVTFTSSLVLPLEYAIFLGILSTILMYLGESSHVNLTYILEDENGQFMELPMDTIKEKKPEIAIVNIEGDLYFAAVEELQDQINRILDSGLKVLILRFRRTHLLASTGIMALGHLIKSAREKDVEVLFCGVHDEIRETLKSSGILESIGQSRIFIANDQLFTSAQKALVEAKALLHQEESNKES